MFYSKRRFAFQYFRIFEMNTYHFDFIFCLYKERFLAFLLVVSDWQSSKSRTSPLPFYCTFLFDRYLPSSLPFLNGIQKPPSVDSDLPCAVLAINKLVWYDFHSGVSQVVHLLYPRHLVFHFERFRYALFFRKLFYQPREHLLCLTVNISEITI